MTIEPRNVSDDLALRVKFDLCSITVGACRSLGNLGSYLRRRSPYRSELPWHGQRNLFVDAPSLACRSQLVEPFRQLLERRLPQRIRISKPVFGFATIRRLTDART